MGLPVRVVGVVFLCTGIGSLAFLWVAYRYRATPGSRGFALVALGISLWSLSFGATTFRADYGVTIASYFLVLFAAQLISVGWLLLAVEFSERHAASRRLVIALASFVAVEQLVVWSNPLHHFVLREGTTVAGTILRPVYGPGFWLHTVLNYGLIVIGTLLLCSEWYRSSGIRRKQAAMLTAATVPPIVANATTVFDLAFTPYDVTPFGFVASGVIFAWALYRLEFLEVVPIARQTAMDQMAEAVITLDSNDRVVDCNPAARDLFGIDEYVGTPAVRFFADLSPDGYTTVRRAIDAERELTTSVDGEQRHFLLSASPIDDDHHTTVGLVVVLRDITPIKHRERALQAREQELDLFRQVLTRVLRHNLRNELATIHGNAEVILAKGDDTVAERAEQIIDASVELADTSEKARRIERVVERDGDTIEHDLRDLVENAVTDVRRRYSETTFEIEGLETCPVQAVPGLDAAITNLVENAAEHNDSSDPRVSISITGDDAAVSLTIADNGPGIPEHEISVLEQAEETPLEHGSGVGLWLVDWVITNADADITFETGENGTTVSIELDRAGPGEG